MTTAEHDRSRTGEAGLEVALAQLLDQVAALDVFQRVALIQQWPGSGRAELRALAITMPHLLALPDDGEETRRILDGLVDGIRQMPSPVRQVYVRTVFDGRIDTDPAKALLDALAAIVGLVDREPG